MSSSSEPWIKELNEASKLADDISTMILERSSLPSGPDAQRHSSAIRRKISILGSKLDSLESFLSKLTSKQHITEKEFNKRRDMIANVRTKAKQMASALNMSNFAKREDLLGESKRSEDAANQIAGLDNHGIVSLQRQVMQDQNEGLEKLEESVLSTKHIALAVNEELDLHTGLIGSLDEHVEVTDSKLQMVQKKLAFLNKRTKGGCSCMCMLLSLVAILILAAIAWALIKHL